MKKFLYNILKFISIAIPVYIIGLSIWSWIMPPFMAKNVRNCVACYGHLYSRAKDAEKIKQPDILFLGSSHAYRGFDTRVFAKHGLKTFNLGSSSQSPINTQVLLAQYLDEIKPKLIVYDVYAETLCLDGVESSLDILSNNKIDQNSIKMAIEINNLKTYNTLFYGYFRQVFNLNKNLVEPQVQDGNYYIKGGGFVESKYRKNVITPTQKNKWITNPKQIKALQDIISYIKKRNIPYILVQVPIAKYYYDSYSNNTEIDHFLSQLGLYENFNGKISLNDETDFYDCNHLNQPAVIKFNEFFIKYLNSHNITQKRFHK